MLQQELGADEDEFDKVFDLNCDAMFALQEQLTAFERQHANNLQQQSIQALSNTFTDASSCPSSEASGTYSTRQSPSAHKNNRNSSFNNFNGVTTATSAENDPSIDAESIRRLQYQMQLLQLENQHFKRENDTLLRDKYGKEGEISIVRSKLQQLEVDNANLKTELLKQESIRKSEVAQVTATFKTEVERLKTRLLFEAQEQSSLSSFHPASTDNTSKFRKASSVNPSTVNSLPTAFHTSQKQQPIHQNASFGVSNTDTSTFNSGISLRTRDRINQVGDTQFARAFVIVETFVNSIVQIHNIQINGKHPLLVIHHLVEHAIVNGDQSLFETCCDALMNILLFDRSMTTINGCIELNALIIKIIKYAVRSNLVQTYNSILSICESMYSRSSDNWIDAVTLSDIASHVNSDNVHLVSFTIGTICESQQLIKEFLVTNGLNQLCMALVTSLNGIKSCQYKLIQAITQLFGRIVFDDELLLYFVRQSLGPLFLLIVGESDNVDCLNDISFLRLIFDLVDMVSSIGRRKSWFETLLKSNISCKLSANSSVSDTYTSVSIQALMDHIQKRDLLNQFA